MTDAKMTPANVSSWLCATSESLLLGTDRARPDTLRPWLELGEDTSGELAADIGILSEQGLVIAGEVGSQISWADWPLALELGAQSLLSFSQPSHLMLELDRRGELGRGNFRYVARWREGAREVDIERYGAYLRHAASGRVMHLDPRSLAIMEAVDHFNALPASDREDPSEAWRTLGTITANAKELGARLDQHLRSNVVVVPSTIGLTIREDEEGRISFIPRIGDASIREHFAVEFERSPGLLDVVSVTLEDNRRARVLLSETQQEVLRRMRLVRKMAGDVARPFVADPAAVFDGVIDAVDLTEVTREYGPRVIGIGPLPTAADIRPDARASVIDRLGLSEPTAEIATSAEPHGEPPSSDALAMGDVPPTPLRTAISLDVLDANTGSVRSVRLADDQAVQALLTQVDQALKVGAGTIRVGDSELRVEQELADVLRRHISGPSSLNGSVLDEGAVGKTGHLYLLINDHDSSLTPAIEVTPLLEVAEVEEADLMPSALHPSIVLKPHQVDGVRWLWASRNTKGRRGGVLADDMGLGKTLQVLVHVAGLIESGALQDSQASGRNGPWRPVLIVAPLLLVESGVWTDEMRSRFADSGRVFEPFVVLRDQGIQKVTHDAGNRDLLGKPVLDPTKIMAHKVVITTYETMMAYQHSLAQRVDGRELWSLVVFDEAQEVKSPKTKQSIAAKALDARFKLCATGTPVETRLRDLWNLLDTVEPARLGTQRDFVSRYERAAMNAATPELRQQALDALRHAIGYERSGALVIRRDKSILRDLPARVEHRIECEMTPLEEDIMQRIRGALSSTDGRRRPLAALQQLHLCTQHPMLAGGQLPKHDANTIIETSSRMASLLELLKRINESDEKVLIFVRSVEAQRLLARVIGEFFNIQVEIVNGQTGVAGNRASSGVVRRQILQRFRSQSGFGVIVLSPFVAGVGLTLVEANHVIHYGRWWNPAIENQATDRAHRIGQTKPVHVYYLIGVHHDRDQPSFDEVLDDLLRERKELARDFLSPASEESNAELLVKRLANTGGMSGNGSPVRVISARAVAATLLSLSRARGERAIWLGDSGLYGVHLITGGKDGVHAFRIVQQASPNDRTILTSGQKAWQQVLSQETVAGQLVVDETNQIAEDRSWADVVAQGVANLQNDQLVDESLLEAVQSVEAAQTALLTKWRRS